MIKKMKKAETTRRKFISGLSLLSAGMILRPLSLFSQEENPILNIGSPVNFLSNKLISNFQKGITSSINSITYSSNSNINFNENNYDVLIGRDSYLEGLIDDGKIAELNKDLIPNNSFIDPKFNNSAFDKDRKHTIPLSYGAIGIAYRKK
jgi:spermidine/putrescine-binding protein